MKERLSGSPRAAMWRNGEKFDLNALALPASPLYLLTAFGINDSGQIVGFGADQDGNVHGFLATPAQTKAVAGPKGVPVTSQAIQLDATQLHQRRWQGSNVCVEHSCGLDHFLSIYRP